MKQRISEHSTVVATKGQVSSDLGGEIVVLDLEAGSYYGLNEVGARVWELVREPRVVREVQATIGDEYDVAPDRARRDVLAVLQQLADEALIEVVDGPTT